MRTDRPTGPAAASARLAELVAGRDTPLFLIEETRIRSAHAALRRGLESASAESAVRYAAKANNELAVLRCLASLETEVMASHLAEAELALEAGFAPARLWLQRPAPSGPEVRTLLDAGVSGFHALRPEDVATIGEAAESRGTRARVALRLSSRAGLLPPAPLRRLAARLGMSPAEALAAAARIVASPSLRLTALNVYVGTQARSAARFRGAIEEAVRVATRIERSHGVRLEEIVVGGGIPSPNLRRLPGYGPARLFDAWPAGDAEDGDSIAARFARAIAETYDRACGRHGLTPPPRLVLETGRSLVGAAGFLVTRVRQLRGRWIFVDASRNHLPESPLLLWRRILVPGGGTPARRRYRHLSGATVNTVDVLDLWRRLPDLAEGDLLVFCDAGAYSISRASRSAGLSPPVLWLEPGGRLRTVRRREGLADLEAPMGPDAAAPDAGAPEGTEDHPMDAPTLSARGEH